MSEEENMPKIPLAIADTIKGEAINQIYMGVQEDAQEHNCVSGWQPKEKNACYEIVGPGTIGWLLREFTEHFDDLNWIEANEKIFVSIDWNALSDNDAYLAAQQLSQYYLRTLEEKGTWVLISRHHR